jgi:hypothetical protein
VGDQVHTWEVSIVFDTAARYVVARDVGRDGLERAIAEGQARIDNGSYIHPEWKTGALAITRTDQTPEARRAHWEAEFYDIDRRGAKRRRYKKPQIERDWEAWVKAERKAEREAAKQANDSYSQKRETDAYS